MSKQSLFSTFSFLNTAGLRHHNGFKPFPSVLKQPIGQLQDFYRNDGEQRHIAAHVHSLCFRKEGPSLWAGRKRAPKRGGCPFRNRSVSPPNLSVPTWIRRAADALTRYAFQKSDTENLDEFSFVRAVKKNFLRMEWWQVVGLFLVDVRGPIFCRMDEWFLELDGAFLQVKI